MAYLLSFPAFEDPRMASPLLQVEPLPFSHFETKSSSLLKHLAEKAPGVTAASRLEVRPAPDMASSGIAQIDALTGGLPRGCLSEICGPDSSGRTSLMLAALAAATQREEVCTLIDVSDAFDPHSAASAGVNLERLLWVRCGSHPPSSAAARKRRPASNLEEWERRRMEDPVEQALRATDLLLQSSGFGMVVIDLAGVSTKMARRVPLTTWFRFRRAVENNSTILLVIGTQPCAESCASLALKLGRQSLTLSRQSPVVSRQETRSKEVFNSGEVLSSRFSVLSEKPSSNDDCARYKENRDQNTKEFPIQHPTHAELLTGIEIQAEVLRARSERKPMQSASVFKTRTAWTA
jgi:recA bacterial DNA recombination protein